MHTYGSTVSADVLFFWVNKDQWYRLYGLTDQMWVHSTRSGRPVLKGTTLQYQWLPHLTSSLQSTNDMCELWSSIRMFMCEMWS